MSIFEITVQRKVGDGWPVVVEHSEPGVFLPVRGEGVLRLDPVDLLEQSTPRGYGTVLGKALFQDPVARAFDRARARSDDRLCVLLFVEDPALKSLHWERLCAPIDLGDDWDFLARDQRVPFSLYLPSLTDRLFPPIGSRDLRALLVVASPRGLDPGLAEFDPGPVVSSIRAALGPIPCDVLATVEGAVGPPTLDALDERITAGRYTLLHLVCHGQLIGDETVLSLATADGQVDRVPGTDLLTRLRALRGARGLPHFAFLATCHSASPKAEGALGGLAQRLVRELGMPAVLAMTEAVTLETARALAEAFYRRLREHGAPDQALVEACAGLAKRGDITVPALYSRLGGRSLFSDRLDRELTDAEIEFGLARVHDLLGERAPVLRERFDSRAEAVRATLGRDLSALSKAARDERDRALAEVNKLCEDALDLDFKAVALGQDPPAYDARCPFRGLYPFRDEDREFFFGRESLIEKLRGKLAEHNFLAVLGPSGSGKSSVVLAGLIPALRDSEPALRLADVTPGSDPLARLEAALSKVREERFVVVVDQFEELFTLCLDEDERRRFLDRLLALAARTRVVITMRADFWGECAPYPALKEIMQARQELIAPMDAAELRGAIDQQAKAVGLRFEADLENTILDDVRGEPGAMPLLQHALLELWSWRHGRWLRTEEYRAIGGVQRAIARTADEVYASLAPAEQGRMREILLRLTRLDEEAARGEERRDTRRRVRLDELIPAGAFPAATIVLVQRLADARLVVTGVDGVTGREVVEVAHEALIRHWPRLRGWLDEDRAGLLVHRRLTQASAEWERQGRHPSELYRGPRLASARAWAAGHPGTLNATEREFLLRGIVEGGVGLRDWLTASGSSREALALAEAYLTSGEAAQQLKGLAILRWLPEPDLEAEIDHRLLEVVQSDRYREAVRERAVEALTERGRADRLADQLRSAGLSPDERSRLIDALGHARNVPKLGVGATNAVGGLDRLRVHWSSVRKLVWVYRTQFGIVFAFSYIATELTWGVLSSLPLFGVGIGLPYSPRALVLTCVCVFYVLFRAYLDERAVSTREVLLATALAIAVHNVLNVFSALRLLGQLFELLTSTLYLAIVAIALSVGPGRGNVRARLLTLSALASALSTALTVVSAFLISPEGFRSRDLPLMILLMWTNGAIVTFACLVAFHQALRIAFGETLLYGAASGADP